MNFDEIIVKESPGLCRCCLSEGCYKDLGKEHSWMGETEVYADILLECFDISISQHNEGPNGANRLICEVCITRLRDACNFKKQVQESEKKFVDMVGRGEFKPKVHIIYQPPLKAEEVEAEEAPGDADVEYLDEDIDFGDVDESVSRAAPARKRGRPRKGEPKPPRKLAKLVKAEEKTKSSKQMPKGTNLSEEAVSKSLSAIKRNRLMKRNAITILELSTAVPFKWHRQNYLCFYCNHTFQNIDQIRDHTKEFHAAPNVKSAVAYLRRDEKVKIDVTSMTCTLCDGKMLDTNAFVDHAKVVHNKTFTEETGLGVIPYKFGKLFQCAICGEEFQYFIKLNQHMNSHFGHYVCESCGKSFLSSDRLRCHYLSHGAGFSCSDCGITFDTLIQKKNHTTQVHNKEKQLACSFCPEKFTNYSQRKQHLRTVHDIEIPTYKCPVCSKTFQIMSKMEVHVKAVHVKEKNFACTMCDQKFFSRSKVQRHMVKHLGERTHQCTVCKKAYARKQTLKDHMKIHDHDRKIQCPLCSQMFVQNINLKLHIKVHHPNESNS